MLGTPSAPCRRLWLRMGCFAFECAECGSHDQVPPTATFVLSSLRHKKKKKKKSGSAIRKYVPNMSTLPSRAP